MSVLGDVTVALTTVVKVVAWVGMVASAVLLAGDALGLIIPPSAFGGAIPTPSEAKLMESGLIFAAGFGGFQIAKWVDGKARAIDGDAHDAELARWQAAQGQSR